MSHSQHLVESKGKQAVKMSQEFYPRGIPLWGWLPVVFELALPASLREQPALYSFSSAAWPSPQSLGRCSSAKYTGNKHHHETMPTANPNKAVANRKSHNSGRNINGLKRESVAHFLILLYIICLCHHWKFRRYMGKGQHTDKMTTYL